MKVTFLNSKDLNSIPPSGTASALSYSSNAANFVISLRYSICVDTASINLVSDHDMVCTRSKVALISEKNIPIVIIPVATGLISIAAIKVHRNAVIILPDLSFTNHLARVLVSIFLEISYCSNHLSFSFSLYPNTVLSSTFSLPVITVVRYLYFL